MVRPRPCRAHVSESRLQGTRAPFRLAVVARVAARNGSPPTILRPAFCLRLGTPPPLDACPPPASLFQIIVKSLRPEVCNRSPPELSPLISPRVGKHLTLTPVSPVPLCRVRLNPFYLPIRGHTFFSRGRRRLWTVPEFMSFLAVTVMSLYRLAEPRLSEAVFLVSVSPTYSLGEAHFAQVANFLHPLPHILLNS